MSPNATVLWLTDGCHRGTVSRPQNSRWVPIRGTRRLLHDDHFSCLGQHFSVSFHMSFLSPHARMSACAHTHTPRKHWVNFPGTKLYADSAWEHLHVHPDVWLNLSQASSDVLSSCLSACLLTGASTGPSHLSEDIILVLSTQPHII